MKNVFQSVVVTLGLIISPMAFGPGLLGFYQSNGGGTANYASSTYTYNTSFNSYAGITPNITY